MSADITWRHLLTVTVLGIPKGQPRSRSRRGQIGVYDPGTADAWKSQIAEAFRRHVPEVPIEDPLAVDWTAFFPAPKSWSKRVCQIYGGRKLVPLNPIHVAKPDRDNLDKALLDVLGLKGLGFMRDDAQVCEGGLLRKRYSAPSQRPGMTVNISILSSRERWEKLSEVVG